MTDSQEMKEIARGYGIKMCAKNANAFFHVDGIEIPVKIELKNPDAEFLNFLTKQEKKNAYAAFCKSGCEDTFSGFIAQFKNDIFNAKTGEPIEIGGDCIATKSIR